jgi:hypothetical protein
MKCIDCKHAVEKDFNRNPLYAENIGFYCNKAGIRICSQLTGLSCFEPHEIKNITEKDLSTENLGNENGNTEN